MHDLPTIGDAAGFLTRDEIRAKILADGIAQRMHIFDGIVSLAELQREGTWEEDAITGSLFRRTPEFMVARADAEAKLIDQRETAEIALAAAMIEMAADLPLQQDGYPTAIAPNRMPYVTVISGEEDRKHGTKCQCYPTSAAAIAAFRQSLHEYASSVRGDTLWWRVRPEINGMVRFGETEVSWYVYSRLMIGNEADTPLARIAAGTLRPTKEMLEDGIVTTEQIAKCGYEMHHVLGRPVLCRFDAPQVPAEVTRALAAALEILPPAVAELPDAPTDRLRVVHGAGMAYTLPEAITRWAENMVLWGKSHSDQIALWLHWKEQPYAEIGPDVFSAGDIFWVVRSTATLVLSADQTLPQPCQ